MKQADFTPCLCVPYNIVQLKKERCYICVVFSEDAEITADSTVDVVDAADVVISAIAIVKMNASVMNVKKKEEEHSVLDSEQVVMILGAIAAGVTVIVTATVTVIVTAILAVILKKDFSNRDYYRSGGLYTNSGLRFYMNIRLQDYLNRSVILQTQFPEMVHILKDMIKMSKEIWYNAWGENMAEPSGR